MLRHSIKGFWTPIQVRHHMGIDIDTTLSYFYAMESKVAKIGQQAKQ
jgi:hypothetical protein